MADGTGGGQPPQDDAGTEGGAAAASEARLVKMEGMINQLSTGMGQLVQRMDAGLVDPKVMEKLLGEVGKGNPPPLKGANPLAGVDFEDMKLGEFAGIFSAAVDEKLVALTTGLEGKMTDAIGGIRQDLAKLNIKDFKKANTDDLDEETMAALVQQMKEEPGISMDSALKLVKYAGLDKKVKETELIKTEEKKKLEAISDHKNIPAISAESFKEVKDGKATTHGVLTTQASQLLSKVDDEGV